MDEDMLPGEVESLDTLPEPIRGFYKQSDDGVYRPAIAPTESGYRFENVANVKGTLAKERAEKRKAEQRLHELEEKLQRYGELDPDEAREALDKLRNGKVTDSEQMKAREKALRDQLGQKHEEELGKTRSELEKLRTGIAREKIEAAGEVAAAKLGIPSRLISAHLREVGRVVEDSDGKLVAAVIGDDGEPRISMREDNTGLMTVEEYVNDVLANDPEIRDFLPQKARGGSPGDRLRAGRARNDGGYDRKMPIEERLAMAEKADTARGAGRPRR